MSFSFVNGRAARQALACCLVSLCAACATQSPERAPESSAASSTAAPSTTTSSATAPSTTPSSPTAASTGAAPQAPAFEPGVELPDGEGREILMSSCLSCHELTALGLFKGFYTRDSWRDLVLTMVANGAEVDSAQVEILSDYLGRFFGPGAP